MKNNFLISLLLIFFSINHSFSNEIFFETQKIDIFQNGNLIKAINGKATTKNENIEFYADNFNYDKNTNILKTNGNSEAVIKSNNLKIRSNKANFYIIEKKIEAFENIELTISEYGLMINADEIFYEHDNGIIKSNSKTYLKDKFDNEYNFDSFVYEINKNLLKVVNLKSISLNGDTFESPIGFINTKTGKIFAKDPKIELDNRNLTENKQLRFEGNSVIRNNDFTEVTKGVFTSCKKRDDCPPWSISAKKIKHDKKKKIINYEDAILRLYDVPVVYFPKFFHPDPSVKRQSGFLIPTIKNSSNSSNFLNTPYFLAITENKDATISPRFYSDNKFLLQTEYRQVNKNSDHFLETSLLEENSSNTKTHLFYNYNKILDSNNFDEASLELQLQKSNNDTYLKKEKIETETDFDGENLINSIYLDLIKEDLSINIKSYIYENLNLSSSDQYEYILPEAIINKKINNPTDLNGNFTFNSYNLIRQYDTNVLEQLNINDWIFESDPFISKFGLYNNYKILLKNSNTRTNNSKNYKENNNFSISNIFQLNSEFPLIKDNDFFREIMKPKLSLKISPNHSKDLRNENTRIDLNNIYSIDRASDIDSTEGGISLTYGNEYSLTKKDNNLEILNFKIANNLRLNENDDLSKINQIGEKTSNFFSEFTYNHNDFWTTKYNLTIKNNLEDVNYERLANQFTFKNFQTSFDYINENDNLENLSFISNHTTYSIDDSNSFSFSTRKNKTQNLTEYYNLMYQYSNDCLAATLIYNKDFYRDRDIRPEQSLMLKLTFIPLGETTIPSFID